MKKVIIYGTGGNGLFLTQHLKKESAEIVAYLDDFMEGQIVRKLAPS